MECRGAVEREAVVVVKLVRSFFPPVGAIVLGVSSLAFIFSFRCPYGGTGHKFCRLHRG